MAEELSLDEERITALSSIGLGRARAGDAQGVADLERALELALACNSPEAARLCNNLGFIALTEGDVRRDAELRAESLRLATRFGIGAMVRFSRGVRVGVEYFAGTWDDCVRHADEFLAECEAGSPHYLESDVRQRRAIVRFARGDTTGAEADAATALELVREVKDPQLVHHVFSSNIRISAELGRLDAARALAA